MPTRSDLTSAQTRDVYYAYDLLGRLTAARFDSASGEGVSFAYDALIAASCPTARPTGSAAAGPCRARLMAPPHCLPACTLPGPAH